MIANKTINSRKSRSVLKIIQCHILILTNIFIFSGGTSKVTNTADKTSVKYSDSYVVNVYSQGYKKHKKRFSPELSYRLFHRLFLHNIV